MIFTSHESLAGMLSRPYPAEGVWTVQVVQFVSQHYVSCAVCWMHEMESWNAEGSQYTVPEKHYLLFSSTHLKPRPLQMNGQNELIDPFESSILDPAF